MGVEGPYGEREDEVQLVGHENIEQVKFKNNQILHISRTENRLQRLLLELSLHLLILEQLRTKY